MVFSDSVVVSARPSDAVAVAMRSGAEIHADEEVLIEAGLVIPTRTKSRVRVEGGRGGTVQGVPGPHVSPDDFNLGGPQ